ncbi:MAG: ABC transporter substrate-binding protein [Zoogloeaceae bacterium]|jgi:branched-chain amino acid transport system substrate-binding protein|nr:ABC transporter substrate-binding protein [Zoogloeaceae bacterium]
MLKKALFALAAAALVTSAAAQIKVGVVSSATGPAAAIGVPQKNTVSLLPKIIAGYTVDYQILVDGGDPTAAVSATKKLIGEQQVDVIFANTTVPNTIAMIPFAADSGTPMIAPVGSMLVVAPMNAQKKWAFKTTQNDDVAAEILFAHMVKQGVKTLGVITTSDPYGGNWEKEAQRLAQQQGVRIVANEKFNRVDTSVTAQALKLVAAKPDAVLIAAPGAPSLLPHVALADRGYRGQIYQSHGAAMDLFRKQGGRKVEGAIVVGSMMMVLAEIPDSNPSKKVMREYVTAYEKAFGEASPFGSQAYDAGLLFANAVPAAAQKAKPGTPEFRAALRDALEATRDLVGTQGRYTMSPQDHSGMDRKGAAELMTIRNGQWTRAR